MMAASMFAIRDGIKDRVETIPTFQGRVFSYIPQMMEPPSVTIIPGTFIPGNTKPSITYDKSFARGSHEYVFTLMVVVSRVVEKVFEEQLDSFISTDTSDSIKLAVESDGSLGGIVSYTTMDRVIEYGELIWNGNEYFGAQMVAEVMA